ncbi:MAG: hypothetical protein ACE5FZ_06660 [Nitrospiria bacterium]
MAKTKYTLIDADDNIAGYAFLNAPTFEHTQPTFVPPIEGPMADAFLFAVVLAGFTAVPWLFGAPGWLSALTGVVMTGTLAGIKAWRGSLLPIEPDPDEVTIKVEHWDFEQGRAVLQQFKDNKITLDLLKKVAKAVIDDGCNFSRPALTKAAGLSQGGYHAVKSEFERLNFCYTDKGNKTHLLKRGKAFLQEVTTK